MGFDVPLGKRSGPEPEGRPALLSYREWSLGERAGPSSGAIVNADDWGENAITTKRIWDCVKAGSVGSVSAMVFMEDSERAAELARTNGVDAGLHLNLTSGFSAATGSSRLSLHHERVAAYLGQSRMTPYVYHPGLASSFRYVVASQFEEFQRLYGDPLPRVDGHHHMHLCANVMMDRLLPRNCVIRRNFSFARGEKSWLNRFARGIYDTLLSSRYKMVDALVPLAPVEPSERLARLFSRACLASVEFETHPVRQDEYEFLMGGGVFQYARQRTDD